MQVEEMMESRIQLQAIYTCAGQLPSHNRVCAQPPNMNRLMVPGQIAIVKKIYIYPNLPLWIRQTKHVNLKKQRVDQVLL